MWLLRGGGTAGMGTILLQCQARALILQCPGDGDWCERGAQHGLHTRPQEPESSSRVTSPGCRLRRFFFFFFLLGSPELSHGRSGAQRMQLLGAHKQHPAWGPH